MLYRLKSGSWIVLADVRRIDVFADAYPHVQLIFTDKEVRIVRMDSFEAAQAYCDELAGLVNAAHQAAAGKGPDGRPKPML